MNAVGLGATALLVANEISTGDAATIGSTLTGGGTSSSSAAAFRRLALGVLAVVILAVMSNQSAPWPGLAAVVLIGLAALWAIHTFAGKHTTSSSSQKGTVLA